MKTIKYTVTYTLPILLTPEGRPTCRLDDVSQCPLQGFKGMREVCSIPCKDGLRTWGLDRENGDGHLIPHKFCPVHSKE